METKKSEYFKRAIWNIKSASVRRLVVDTLDRKVPDYILTKWAASTGKYHPMGMDGSMETIADHTLKVVLFVKVLLGNPCFTGGFSLSEGVIADSKLSEEQTDLLYASAILHDCAKYGLDTDNLPAYTLFSHPLLVKELYPYELGVDLESERLFARIVEIVASHEGIWNTSKKEPDVVRPLPNDIVALLLHEADFLASRNNVHIYYKDSNRGLWARVSEAVRGWWNEKVRYKSLRNPKWNGKKYTKPAEKKDKKEG